MATDDKLGDWRIDSAAQLAEDYDNAPAGTPIWLMSVAKHKRHNYLSFVTPSAAALCLSIAMDSAACAEAIRPKLSLNPMLTPAQPVYPRPQHRQEEGRPTQRGGE